MAIACSCAGGIQVADFVVRTPIAQKLLQRLRRVLGPDGSIPPIDPVHNLRGVTGEELARRHVQYSLLCLSGMGEYQEILTPFFQVRGAWRPYSTHIV